jgi:hypothetical protein
MFSGCLFGGAGLNSIVVSADAEEVDQGKAVNLEVKGFDKKNKELPVLEPEWKLSDETKGALVADGVKAVFTAGLEATGTVEITVTSGKLSDSIEIEIVDVGSTPGEFDKTELAAAIAEAEELIDETEIGEFYGEISEAEQAKLKAAVAAAKVVNDDAQTTQRLVNAAVTDLNAAIKAFKDAISIVIPMVFEQDFSNAEEAIVGWVSPNAQEQLTIIDSTEAKYGNVLNFKLPASTNSRGFHFFFPEEMQVGENRVLELDVKILKGNNQNTQFAVVGKDPTYTNNWLIDQSYLVRFDQFPTADKWEINGNVVEVMPNDTWLNVQVVMNFDGGTSDVTIKNGSDVLFQQTVPMAEDVEALGGLYFISGRYNSVISVDNIKVYDQKYLGL